MSWQDELRKLDEELAAGRLSADDYRVRRDQVLSSAVAPGGPAPTPPPAPAEATTVMPSIGDTGPGDPAEKTQIVSSRQAAGHGASQGGNGGNGGRAGGDEDSAEKTQIVSSRDMAGERTQTVSQGQGWQAARPADPDRTQAVPGVPAQHQTGPLRPPPGGHHSPPSGFQQPQQGGWNQQQQQQPPQQQDDAPLWVGSDFPPLASSGSPDWVKQGPEVFSDSSSGGGGKGKIIAIVVAVVVLAGAAFGAYWLWGRDSGGQAGSPPPNSSTAAPGPSSTPPPPDRQPVGKVAPQVTVDAGVSDFSAIPSRKFLTDPELKAYQSRKASTTRLAIGSLGDGSRVVVLIVEMPDAASAKAAAKTLDKIQIGNGMAKSSDGPSGVLVENRAPKDGNDGRYRAHYVHDNMIVRLDVNGKDAGTLLSQFNSALAAQLQALPVTG